MYKNETYSTTNNKYIRAQLYVPRKSYNNYTNKNYWKCSMNFKI